MLTTTNLIASQKIVQAITGFVTVIFVALFLSPNEQGYFYTMGSLLNCYILIDLGLSSLIVQKSAQYFVNLDWQMNYLVGTKKKLVYFLSFSKWVQSWYKKLGFFSLIIFPIGLFYFSLAVNENEINVVFPFFIIIICLSLSIPTIGFLSVLEGAKKINEVYILRIIQYLFGGIIAWILLYTGHGIYALAAAPFATFIVVTIFSFFSYRVFLNKVKQVKQHYSWKSEVLPQQKKVGINWLSNYLFLHLPTPIVFYISGPIDAGKFGLTFVITNISIAICMSPFTAVIPLISELIEKKENNKSIRIFSNALFKCLLLILLITLLLYFSFSFLKTYTIFERILNFNDVLLIFLSFTCFYFVTAFVVFFRSYKIEPFTLLTLGGSVFLVIFGSYILINYSLTYFIGLIFLIYFLLLIYVFSYFMIFLNKTITNE